MFGVGCYTLLTHRFCVLLSCVVLWQIESSCPEALLSTDDGVIASEVKAEEKGLSDVVRLCLGRPLNKAQQMSDWERRPLRHQQILYAGICPVF